MAITIRGASDDIVEVEGDIEAELYDTAFGAGVYVYLSTGLVLYFELGERDEWRARVERGDASTVAIERDEDDNDEATISIPVDWVAASTDAPAIAR